VDDDQRPPIDQGMIQCSRAWTSLFISNRFKIVVDGASYSKRTIEKSDSWSVWMSKTYV